MQDRMASSFANSQANNNRNPQPTSPLRQPLGVTIRSQRTPVYRKLFESPPNTDLHSSVSENYGYSPTSTKDPLCYQSTDQPRGS